jgi:hypothetical protein
VQHAEQLAELVHEEYRDAIENSEWVNPADAMPGDLSVSALRPYISDRFLSVYRWSDDRDRYSVRVVLVPYWDQEHGLYLRFDGGTWTRAQAI